MHEICRGCTTPSGELQAGCGFPAWPDLGWNSVRSVAGHGRWEFQPNRNNRILFFCAAGKTQQPPPTHPSHAHPCARPHAHAHARAFRRVLREAAALRNDMLRLRAEAVTHAVLQQQVAAVVGQAVQGEPQGFKGGRLVYKDWVHPEASRRRE